MVETAPVAFSAIPLIAVVVLVTFVAARTARPWKREHRVEMGLLWALQSFLLLVLEGLFCLNGLVGKEVGALETLLYLAVLLAAGVLTNCVNRYSGSLTLSID